MINYYTELHKEAQSYTKLIKRVVKNLFFMEKLEKIDKAASLKLETFDSATVIKNAGLRFFRALRNQVSNNWRNKAEFWSRLYDLRNEFRSENIDKVKSYMHSLGAELTINPRNHFYYERDSHTYGNDWNEFNTAFSLFIFKNNTYQEKKFTIYTYLSCDNNWSQTRICIINEGNCVYEQNGNGFYSPSFTVVLPPNKKRHIVAIQNGAYRWTTWNGAWYVLRHNIWFDLPEGVDYDFEAYAEILKQ